MPHIIMYCKESIGKLQPPVIGPLPDRCLYDYSDCVSSTHKGSVSTEHVVDGVLDDAQYFTVLKHR
jgi:hypothetical protein